MSNIKGISQTKVKPVQQFNSDLLLDNSTLDNNITFRAPNLISNKEDLDVEMNIKHDSDHR